MKLPQDVPVVKDVLIASRPRRCRRFICTPTISMSSLSISLCDPGALTTSLEPGTIRLGSRIHEQKNSKVSNGSIRYVKHTEIFTHATHVNGWFPAVYMNEMSQIFCLFYVSNLSVRNFRISMLMYPGSYLGSLHQHGLRAGGLLHTTGDLERCRRVARPSGPDSLLKLSGRIVLTGRRVS